VQCGRDAGGGAFAESPEWRVEADGEGRVRVTRRADGLAIDDAVRGVCEGDRGDEYNFDPVPGDAPIERPERVRVRPFSAGEAEAGVEIEARYRVPEGLTHERSARAERQVALPVRLRLRLREGSDRIDLDLDCDNRAQDHRLRVLLRAPFRARRFEVESAFEVAQRPIAPAPPDPAGPPMAERPIGACPQRRFAGIDDGRLALTVANRGAAEVEAVPETDGTTSLAVTVLRAVGWLSRDDLVLRPGHAGPGLETPGAQVPGPHRLELSLRLHPADDPLRTVRAHDFARPPQAFPGGGPARAPLSDGSRLLEVEPADAVLVSAVEPRAQGGALVRIP
jgi:alpha-mannosidase